MHTFFYFRAKNKKMCEIITKGGTEKFSYIFEVDE